MATGRSWTKALFGGIWAAINFIRRFVLNVIFFVILIGIIVAIMSEDKAPTVKQDSALVLNLKGNLVIQQEAVDPVEEFMQEALDEGDDNPEVLLQDLLFVIANAKDDPRIKTLVLQLDGMGSAGLDKLRQVGEALDDFKASGKTIYAIGDNYSQNQYYLASHADHLYMNPMGWMLLEGYGRYPMYFKSMLEKLKVTTHVFKVGTFKSAIEPFIRDDMSDAARQANEAWLSALWQQYKQDIATARHMDLTNFDEKLESFMPKFADASGDFALYAQQNGWVDALKSREDIRAELSELVGSDDSDRGYRHITYKRYLNVIKGPDIPVPANDTSKVAIVVAKGSILNGTQKPGSIGGDSTARLLRDARMDSKVKAVVLYVDSPGGSAFASEIIRQEIEQLKLAGKPVVAMMSTYAASGGYWISASADEIWASPSTITGSIGIFGMFMTYENTLDYVGIHTDGLGTTDFAGISATRPLDPRFGDILQKGIEKGYDQFISLVAKERHMSKEDVDKIAQGRVWIGATAQQLGLVDHLGELDDAVAAAAKLANLDNFETKYIEPKLSDKQKLMKKIFGQANSLIGKAQFADSDSQFISLLKTLVKEFDTVTKLNDPKGVYAFCLACEI